MINDESRSTLKASQEIIKLLGNRDWRLDNLYTIRDVEGNAVPFIANNAQRYLYNNMHYFNVILKARQLGFSTFIMIYLLDSCLFNSNQSCGVISHTISDAQELFRNKIRFAYDALPDWLKSERRAFVDSARKLEFDNGSSIVVGTSLRGGTYQKLHVSEYGKIAARYPEKAREIKTGALNAIHQGQQVFVESTAEGKSGEFFELCEVARKLRDLKVDLSPLDPKMHFFPWYNNPDYRMSGKDCDNSIITKALQDYFKHLPIDLEPEQKAWYAKKSELMGDMMKREFPSTETEAFESSLDGAYYTKEMALLRKRGQITSVPHTPSQQVCTFWDLGKGSGNTAIWFMQQFGDSFRFIDYHESNNEGWDFYANLLKSKGFVYRTHYFPHDGNSRVVGKEIYTAKQMAYNLGINPITVVTRTRSVYSDIINKCKPSLTLCWFDKANCDQGIKHLDSYRREWDDKTSTWKDKHLEDESAHCADAFRTFASGYEPLADSRKPLVDFNYNNQYGGHQQFADNDYDIF